MAEWIHGDDLPLGHPMLGTAEGDSGLGVGEVGFVFEVEVVARHGEAW